MEVFHLTPHRPMTETNEATLHELMRQANGNWGSGEDTAWLQQLRDLLDAGALPNELDEHEMSPLAILVDNGIGNSTAYTQGVALMIERGANPLINDRALGKAAQSANIGPDGGLAGAMLAALIRKEETGRLVRSETNETALHVLCTDAPVYVGPALGAPGGMGLGEARIPRAWITALDEDGNQPLHSMWKEGGIVYDRLDAGMDVDDELGAWESTQAMVGMGADLLARDGQKNTVANLILACVELGMPTEDAEIWPEVEALATHERMEHKTQRAKRAGGKPGRL